MSENAGLEVRFCDEYENLMSEFVRALSVWTQLSCFQEDPQPSKSPLRADLSRAPSAPTNLAQAELVRSGEGYAAALWALRMHSRNCLLCEETLRVQVNGDIATTAKLNPSCC